MFPQGLARSQPHSTALCVCTCTDKAGSQIYSIYPIPFFTADSQYLFHLSYIFPTSRSFIFPCKVSAEQLCHFFSDAKGLGGFDSVKIIQQPFLWKIPVCSARLQLAKGFCGTHLVPPPCQSAPENLDPSVTCLWEARAPHESLVITLQDPTHPRGFAGSFRTMSKSRKAQDFWTPSHTRK